MTRDEWAKQQIAALKNGGTVERICTMATDERLAAGLCQRIIPDKRVKRSFDTCSPECQQDKNRIKRWLHVNDKCRVCGHGLPKPKTAKPKARQAQEAVLPQSQEAAHV